MRQSFFLQSQPIRKTLTRGSASVGNMTFWNRVCLRLFELLRWQELGCPDFYADYYVPYYTKALKEIDSAQHPAAKQDEARKNNDGKDLKKGNNPDASYRIVTAAGSRLTDDGVV